MESSSHSHGALSSPVRSTAWRASQGAMFSSEFVRRHCARLCVGRGLKRKPALRRHSSCLQLLEKFATARPAPQPGHGRDPSRSWLKPEERQRPQIMIRAWTSVEPEGLLRHWLLSGGHRDYDMEPGPWPDRHGPMVIMTVTHPALGLWPRLRLRVSCLGLAVSLWLGVKAWIRLSLESEPLTCSATATLTICPCYSILRYLYYFYFSISYSISDICVYDQISGQILCPMRYLIASNISKFFWDVSKQLQIYHSIIKCFLLLLGYPIQF